MKQKKEIFIEQVKLITDKVKEYFCNPKSLKEGILKEVFSQVRNGFIVRLSPKDGETQKLVFENFRERMPRLSNYQKLEVHHRNNKI